MKRCLFGKQYATVAGGFPPTVLHVGVCFGKSPPQTAGKVKWNHSSERSRILAYFSFAHSLFSIGGGCVTGLRRKTETVYKNWDFLS